MESLAIRQPQMETIGPNWFHHHGIKMKVEKFDEERRHLLIVGSAAGLLIKPTKEIDPDAPSGWIVEWRVVQSKWCGLEVIGRRWFTDEELAAAFGLSQDSDASGQWLINRFGGESASQGKYIRWQEYLNIPCPGTGHDGDPNISIVVDDAICAAVKELLALAA